MKAPLIQMRETLSRPVSTICFGQLYHPPMAMRQDEPAMSGIRRKQLAATLNDIQRVSQIAMACSDNAPGASPKPALRQCR